MKQQEAATDGIDPLHGLREIPNVQEMESRPATRRGGEDPPGERKGKMSAESDGGMQGRPKADDGMGRAVKNKRALKSRRSDRSILFCDRHPKRRAHQRAIRWVKTSTVHAYPIDLGLRCRGCIRQTRKDKPWLIIDYRHPEEPIPAAY